MLTNIAHHTEAVRVPFSGGSCAYAKFVFVRGWNEVKRKKRTRVHARRHVHFQTFTRSMR